MARRNGYAALSRQRAAEPTKRRKLDDYETPEDVTARLLKHVKFRGPFFDPCGGSGRIKRAIVAAYPGSKVALADIKTGQNFLDRKAPFAGDIITNFPYRDGLAEAMTRHALKIADGRVAALMQSGFSWGGKRGVGLFAEYPPEFEVVIPERIYFLVNGKPIDSQFFSHSWLVWAPRKIRDGRARLTTRKIWAPEELEFG